MGIISERNLSIFEDIASKKIKNYNDAANKYNITNTRVQQIYKKMLKLALSKIKKARWQEETILHQRSIIKDLTSQIIDERYDKILQENRNTSRFIIFNKEIQDIDLSVRSMNCLLSNGIKYVGDLVVLRESEVLRTPNFGRKSLQELRDVLSNFGLYFDMDITGWKRPEENNKQELK